MSRRSASLLALSLLLLSILAAVWGCAQQAAGPGSTPAPSGGQPKSGGTLNIWYNGAAAGFDLHRQASYSPYYVTPIFNGLLRFDPSRSDLTPQAIQGDLAADWKVSTDGTEITFNLVRNAQWHDGRPFTADDVIYSFDKMRDPKRSLIAGNFTSVKTVQKIDDFTVKVALQRPQPAFIASVAGSMACMQASHLASANWQSTDFNVGTGPFKWKDYVAGVSADLVKNPNYFKKGLPYLDGIRINVIADRSAQVDAFALKKVDMTHAAIGVMNDEVLTRHKQSCQGEIIDWATYENPQLFFFNTASPTLKDVRIRKALTLATDMDALITAGFGGPEFRDRKYAISPRAFAILQSETYRILGWDKPYADRVAEAKKLLAEAGHAQGLKIKIVINNQPELTRMIQTMGDQYRRSLGVEAELVPLPYNESNQAIQKGNYDICGNALASLSGDPDEGTNSFVTGGLSNFYGYSNQKVDQLVEQQSRELDFAKRKQMVQEIERTVLGDFLGLPQGFSVFGVARWPYVKGFAPGGSPYNSMLRFEGVWLDK